MRGNVLREGLNNGAYQPPTPSDPFDSSPVVDGWKVKDSGGQPKPDMLRLLLDLLSGGDQMSAPRP